MSQKIFRIITKLYTVIIYIWFDLNSTYGLEVTIFDYFIDGKIWKKLKFLK